MAGVKAGERNLFIANQQLFPDKETQIHYNSVQSLWVILTGFYDKAVVFISTDCMGVFYHFLKMKNTATTMNEKPTR